MSAEQVVDLYERHALEWVGDRSRMRLFFEKGWLDRFAGVIQPGGTVLDIGCGPGKPLAAYLRVQGFDICGVDSSPTMIALSRQNFPGQEWLVADMRSLALGRQFDGLLAWDSFFHLGHDDQRRMFPIFRAHAEPGAPLLFTSGPQHGEAIGSFRGEPLYHASLDGAEYRALLNANGFDVVDYAIDDPDCDKHTVWLAQRRR
jgi:SAM-dependent methyltransferase